MKSALLLLPALLLLACGDDTEGTIAEFGKKFGALCTQHTGDTPSEECGLDLHCLTDGCHKRCVTLCEAEGVLCPNGYKCDDMKNPPYCYPTRHCAIESGCPSNEVCTIYVNCPEFSLSYCIPQSYDVPEAL
jgi:hypothetical protein